MAVASLAVWVLAAAPGVHDKAAAGLGGLWPGFHICGGNDGGSCRGVSLGVHGQVHAQLGLQVPDAGCAQMCAL